MSRRSTWLGAAAAVAAMALPMRVAAHKPITSPYTFTEDVFPIVRERCGACHVAGGVAPMSLMTQPEAVPWGESIRTELMAGHMPPWRVESAAARFRNASGLTARELNILMTWVTGGTPLGKPAPTAAAGAARRWSGGAPDLVLQPDAPFTLAADRQEETAEFTLQTRFAETRWIRGADLLPGTPAIVRSATLSIDSAAGPSPAVTDNGRPLGAQRLVSLWLPGDPMVALENAAIELPPRAVLTLRVRYRKTWEHEREAMRDLSQVGLYFAAPGAPSVRALTLSAAGEISSDDTVTFSRVIDRDLQALAIYPDVALEGAGVRVTATAPGGQTEELIAFHPPVGWQRRYWFAAPVALPRGTRIEVRARFNDTAALLPPGATPQPRQDPDPARVRLTLDVVEQ